ncbi:MAG: toll/interleukin-1 receptor domain-containing protein [Ferruginibacter sp.]
MPLYNSSYLRQRSLTKTFSQRQRILNESHSRSSFDIFLSHSYVDKEDVQALYDQLTDMDFSVYVDWIVDPHLDRTNVTKESATLVRKRMKSSASLLLAISPDAILSKWVPWELGYVDGNTSRCAIIPVSKNVNPPKTFKGVEYLQLYPYIKHARVGALDEVYVIESSNNYTSLTNWINKNENPNYKSVNIDLL